MSTGFDLAVIGAGLVGSALAYGCQRAGARVALCDAGDDDFHASAANFGLVWVQGKGLGAPAYAALSRRSADAWAGFADDLRARTGVDPSYRRCGGVKLALGDAELRACESQVARLRAQPGGGNDLHMVDRATLDNWFSGLGPDVSGGVYCPHDGHADPLATLRALRLALQPAVERIRSTITRVEPRSNGGFLLHGNKEAVFAERVVLAAGLGSLRLSGLLGLDAAIRPQRGQILVTARQPRFLDKVCHTLRQTVEGTVMIGDSKEDVGFDRGTTQDVTRQIVARAVRLFPHLADAAIVRSWGGLRVLSTDGLPIYQASVRCPGAYLLTCHSGVTLAAAHAGEVADALVQDRLTERYPAFSPARFREAA